MPSLGYDAGNDRHAPEGDPMNRQNHDKRMQALVEGIKAQGIRPRLLLHSCCAPCSTAVLERLCEAFDITLYFYNPNMDTREEHDLRAAQLKALAGMQAAIHVVPYDPAPYLAAVQGLAQQPEGGARCMKCFQLRLHNAAAYAKAQGFDCYTTTLTISPMKNAALLNDLGAHIGEEAGIPFLPSDFKKRGGYQRSIELSRENELYRQDYCGCIWSKRS